MTWGIVCEDGVTFTPSSEPGVGTGVNTVVLWRSVMVDIGMLKLEVGGLMVTRA